MTIAQDTTLISDDASVKLSRRQFVGGVAALTLAIGFRGKIALAASDSVAQSFEPNAFIRIDSEGQVTVVSLYLEMGQGTFTGLATMAAEELDVSLSRVTVTGSPADVEKYANPIFANRGFKAQATGGSTAMAGAWTQLRQAAATARAMLVNAAAKTWGVPAAQLTVEDGVVIHPATGKRIGYGDLIGRAAKEPIPTQVAVKQREQFQLIGKSDTQRLDIPSKVNGTAIYTQDIQLPGMLVAVIAHPPKLWGKVRSVDDRAALTVRDVVAVLTIVGDEGVQGGIAVLARNTWAARQGREALKIEWEDSGALQVDSAAISETYRQRATSPGLVVSERGAVLEKAPQGGKLVTAVYEQPYLAHAPMEPMNCVVQLSPGKCEIWNGEQWHTGDNVSVAKDLGLSLDQVHFNQLLAGGSFGRRANPRSDFVREAVLIAKSAQDKGLNVPIKMVWMREDDMRAAQYRPFTVHRIHAALDAAGKLVSWHHRIVGQSFIPAPDTAKKPDDSLIEGTSDTPYTIPNLKVEQLSFNELPIPTAWIRSVGHTHTAYAMETFIDQVAVEAGSDPFVFRQKLLQDSPRDLAVIELVAQKANWTEPLSPGTPGTRRGRGIAVHSSFGTYVAQVAEVTLHSDGNFTVDRVVCAVDCGIVINPDIVRAQVEGGIVFGISFLNQAITFKSGQVVESNFHDFPVLRMNEMPKVEVYTVHSLEAPTGIGEPGTPPAAPAVANALSSITGKRYHILPLRKDALT